MRKMLAMVVLLGSSVALADGHDWAVIGNACVPDHKAIQEGLYENRGVGVGFQPGAYGTIRLTCALPMDQWQDGSWGAPVGASYKNWHKLVISYKDEDEGSSTYLNVKLRYAHFSSPAVAQTWANITPAFPPTSGYGSTIEVDIKDLNPGLASYWWFEVTITRKEGAKGDVEFLGIAIK